jgi:hypothetical protein
VVVVVVVTVGLLLTMWAACPSYPSSRYMPDTLDMNATTTQRKTSSCC